MKERTEEESRSKTQGGAFGEVAGESGTKAFGSSQEMCLVILGQAKKRKKRGKGRKKNIRKIKQGKENEKAGGHGEKGGHEMC